VRTAPPCLIWTRPAAYLNDLNWARPGGRRAAMGTISVFPFAGRSSLSANFGRDCRARRTLAGAAQGQRRAPAPGRDLQKAGAGSLGGSATGIEIPCSALQMVFSEGDIAGFAFCSWAR